MKVEIEINSKLYDANVDAFVNVVKPMINLYARKNHDYGNSFDENCERFGIVYATSRMYDKLNRVVNLTRNPNINLEVKDETIKDTIQDLANYAVMYLAYLNKKNDKFNNVEPYYSINLAPKVDNNNNVTIHRTCIYDVTKSDPD